MKLIKAIGEEAIDFDEILSVQLIGLAVCRGYHKKIDCIILDFGLPKRLLIQCTPTDLDDEFELDVLTFRLIDHSLQNEKELAIDAVQIQKVERITTDYDDQDITVGIRLISDGEPLDILSGNILASLAVYGWGFPASDQQSAFPLDQYRFIQWK